jgi:hypothetical protein
MYALIDIPLPHSRKALALNALLLDGNTAGPFDIGSKGYSNPHFADGIRKFRDISWWLFACSIDIIITIDLKMKLGKSQG